MARDEAVAFLRRYLADLSWVAGGIGAALLVDFVFYILAGRLMGPTEFGYFGVVTALYYIFLRSPFRALEMTAKKIQAEGGDSLRAMGRGSVMVGLGVFLIALLAAGPAAAFLGIPHDTMLAFALVFPAGYLLAVLVGTVQGDKQYRRYGMYEFLSSLLAFSTLALVYHGFGATGAALMFVIEIVAGLAVLWRGEAFPFTGGGFDRYGLLVDSFAVIIAVHAAFSLDILLVNRFFSTATTGLYNTVAVLGKGLFFASVAVNRTVFPKFVTDTADRRRNLHLSQLLVAGGGVAAAGVFTLVGDLFLTYTFGPAFVEAAGFAPQYFLMITGISLVALLANYCLSTGIRRVRLIVLLPVLQVALIWLFHSSVIQVIYATFAAAALTAVVLNLVIRRSRNGS